MKERKPFVPTPEKPEVVIENRAVWYCEACQKTMVPHYHPEINSVLVPSFNRPGHFYHEVDMDQNPPTCTCEWYQYRFEETHKPCRHLAIAQHIREAYYLISHNNLAEQREQTNATTKGQPQHR